jgi:hypothetical protein
MPALLRANSDSVLSLCLLYADSLRELTLREIANLSP